MTNNIYPCLWFDGQAKAAAEFYSTVFEDAKIIADTPMVVTFELYGKKIMGLNGGPMFKINPSISFFIYCSSAGEVDQIWQKLKEDAHVLMTLDTYPWSEKYGWVADKFGVSWQVMLSAERAGVEKIVPAFLFAGEQYGRAYEAIEFYTSIFPDSEITSTQFYQANEAQTEGNLTFAQFSLKGALLSAMDGAGQHQFAFNEGVSLVVPCKTQDEIDFYWNRLTEGGQESRCGWLIDKFGVSWQIVPSLVGQLLSNPATAGKVTEALMKMKKLDLATLLAASKS